MKSLIKSCAVLSVLSVATASSLHRVSIEKLDLDTGGSMYERVQGVVSRHSTTPQQQQEAPNGPKTPSNKPPRIDAELTPVQYNPPEVIFVGQVGLGTPLQNFRLAFEIGSADTWVALENVNCKDPEPCSPKRQVFYPQRSSTFDPAPNKHWEVRLSDKSKVEGWLHTDVLQVAEFAISHQVIGMATAMTGFKDMGADGTFALGLSSLAARAGDATPIENLITANGMKSEVGIWLGSGKQGGELIFGGNDPESFKGDLSYFDLPNKSVYWAIPAASISVDEAVASAETETGTPGTTTTTPSSSKIKQINRLGQDSKLPNVIFDTSSNLILLPPRVATRLHRYIQNHIFGLYTGYNLFIKAFTVPCNLNKDIWVELGPANGGANNRFKILGKDIVQERVTGIDGLFNACYSGIQMSNSDDDDWVFGNIWFMNNYMTLDYTNRRVGIAPVIRSEAL